MAEFTFTKETEKEFEKDFRKKAKSLAKRGTKNTLLFQKNIEYF